MTEENKTYENNPFKNRLVIPVSVAPKIIEPAKIEEEPMIKKEASSEKDDEPLSVAAINIQMSPALHTKFKILCITEGISIKEKILEFIKKEVKKTDKKSK